VLAILCLVLMTLLTTCLFRNNHDYEGSWDSSYSSGSYYDSESFWQQDDRVFYESEDGAVGKTGVDVSAYQADIDWWAVAADGIDYAMIRIAWRGNTDGYLHEDICFEQNWAGTQEVGIPCGVYFFSQAVTVEEAREEAVFALDLLAGRELTYPVVFDYEANDGHRLAGIDRETATACARTFCDIISEGGYEPMIYGNRYDLQYLDISQLSDIPIWFAEYSQAPSFEEPFAMWQYTNSGSVAGIGTPADLNLSFSTAPSTEGESL
jgi:GH25 family lysozyme M1 (1,4-beta-N-acetylmuramidase)